MPSVWDLDDLAHKARSTCTSCMSLQFVCSCKMYVLYHFFLCSHLRVKIPFSIYRTELAMKNTIASLAPDDIYKKSFAVSESKGVNFWGSNYIVNLHNN